MEKDELIKRYFEDNLTEEEEKVYEELLKTDPSFEEEVLIYMKTANLVSDDEIMNFRDELSTIIQGEKPKEKLWPRFMIAAVITALIVFSGVFVYNNYWIVEDPDLFATYYEEVNTPRSGELDSNDILRIGFDHFRSKEWDEAITEFHVIVVNDPENFSARFYLAMSYIESEKFNKAINHFDYLIRNNNNLFTEKARWYLALCYLKLNKKNQSLELLEKISQSDSCYSDDAKKLINDISE